MDEQRQASLEAKKSIDAKSMRAEVARFIKNRADYGATCEETENALAMKHQTASARITELAKAKKIKPCGGFRMTASNRRATVYIWIGDRTP